MKEYSIPIARAINDFLKRDDWRYSFDDEEGVFSFSLNIRGKIKSISYVIRVRGDEYTVYAVSSISADENDPECLSKMSEFICRVNYGIRNGCFEMDHTDGEIRYKSYVDCDESMPSDAVIRNSVYLPASMFERYGPGILAVMFAGADPEDAVSACEADLN